MKGRLVMKQSKTCKDARDEFDAGTPNPVRLDSVLSPAAKPAALECHKQLRVLMFPPCFGMLK